MQVKLSSNSFIFLSLTGTMMLRPTFHKIDKKTFKDIILGLHFNTFVNILPKLRYFKGRNYIQLGLSYIFFPIELKKGGDILGL